MYEIMTAPLVEPLSPADIRSEHLRLDVEDHDDYVNSLIKTVRTYYERQHDLAFITQTIKEYCKSWPIYPAGRIIKLSVRPVQSVTSVKYYDTDNVLQTLDSSKYRVNIVRNGLIEMDENESFPSLYNRNDAIEIIYVAGYADKGVDVPEHVRHGLSMMVAKFYEQKEDNANDFTAGKFHLMPSKFLMNPELDLIL